MKATGIIRKVDELGRIVLPIELRRTLDISTQDEMEIFAVDDQIVLHKHEPTCVFCNSTHDLIPYKNKNICRECIKHIHAD